MTNGNIAEEEKGYSPEAVRRSPVIPQPESLSPPQTFMDSLLWAIGSVADDIEPWGRNHKLRDRQLRNFAYTEHNFASALGTVCSRNAAFSWRLEGNEAKVKKYQKLFEEANFGKGWVDLIIKTSVDMYTQDNGGFIGVVRERDSPESDIIGLNTLDASRCWHTGAPESPVVYQNRLGQYKLLKWYQVITLTDMPMPNEEKYGLQLCALSRLLTAAQIIRNISIYDYEKTGGRYTRAVHLLRGITAKAVTDAIEAQGPLLDARGQRRFSLPLVVSSVSPDANVGHDTLELATLPDNLDREGTMKWYVAQMALAFFEDYQTFAPLPGGNLGTSQQSQILHSKSRGKGPGLFQKILAHALNFNVLPSDIEFQFDEQDLEEERDQATVRQLRATERQIRIQSGEITPAIARVLAKDSGDLPQELLDAYGEEDLTADVSVNDTSSADAQIGPQSRPASTQSRRRVATTQQQIDQTRRREAQQASGQREQSDRAGPGEVRLEVEETITDMLDGVFSRLGTRLQEIIEADT